MAPDIDSMPRSGLPANGNRQTAAPVANGVNGTNGASGKQPNILFLMADQLAAPLLKMYNSESQIKTPNLDALAASLFSSTRLIALLLSALPLV